jgi:hypothetical protein
MWGQRKFEDLMSGEAELVLFRGKVWTHAHTESAVGRLGRVAADRPDGVWGGGWVGVVRIVKGEGLDIGGRGEERLIPGGVGDRRSEGVWGNDLRHGKGKEATLWREEHYVYLIYSKDLWGRGSKEVDKERGRVWWW